MKTTTVLKNKSTLFEAIFWVAVALSGVFFNDYLPFITLILIYGLFAVSLDIALGYAGILTVGHAAFFGMGAYVAGLYSIYAFSEPISGLLIAGFICAVVGYLLSFLIVRAPDLSRLMITIGMVVLLGEVVRRFSSITGGTDGLLGIDIAPIFGMFEFDFDGKVGFVYTFIVVLLMFLIARRILRSPFGYGLKGIHDNPTRMLAIGTPIVKRLRWAYSLAAMFAGVAGALLAQTNQFVGIETLSFDLSAQVLIILIIGGTGRLYGGMIGAIVYMLLHDYFADMSPEYWMFWLGIFLIMIVSTGRGGVMALLKSALKERKA